MIDYSTLKQTAEGLPTWDSLLPVMLQQATQRKRWKAKELKQATLDQVKMPADLRNLTYDNGRNVAMNRASFALSDLRVAGLLSSPKRSVYEITELGKKMVKTYGLDLNKMVVHQLPQYTKHRAKVTGQVEQADSEQTVPTLSAALTKGNINDWFDEQREQTKDELLARMAKINHYRFEELMVHLFAVMGYKGDNGQIQVTKRSKDGGIDGVLSQDPLGFQKVYIQVKHYRASDIVQQHAIMEFGTAMKIKHASQGVFITTSSFTRGAKEMADQLGIILVDGDQLTDLMIEYRAGINVKHSYDLYSLDADFFAEYEEDQDE